MADTETDAVVLTSPRRAELPGTVVRELVPGWRRGAAAGAIGLVGLVLAVPAVILPPHGVVSALVLGGAGLGGYAAWSRAELVREVAFTCTCGAEARVGDVGPWSADLWVRCPSCAAPWKVPPRGR